MTRVAVLGGGSWGTALAQAVSQANHDVVLWARDQGLVDEINAGHENPRYLPGMPLDPGIRATGDLASAAAGGVAMLGLVYVRDGHVVATRALAQRTRLPAPDVIYAFLSQFYLRG